MLAIVWLKCGVGYRVVYSWRKHMHGPACLTN